MDLAQRFRDVARERLSAIEAAWAKLQADVDDAAAAALKREVHNLKGESRLLEFVEVCDITHKLEDLLEVARLHGYALDDDLDLAIGMAIRFLGKLVDEGSAELDVRGFVEWIDTTLAAARIAIPRTRTGASLVRAPQRRVTRAMREELSPIAVDVFLAYELATGPRRSQLRSSWQLMQELVGVQRAVLGREQLQKHIPGATALAKDLGKTVTVELAMETVEVTTDIFAAVDVAVLHLVRNAIDHGIEAERGAKPAAGTVHIRTRATATDLVLEVSDDGRGLDYERLRARAVELGRIDPAAAIAPDQLVELAYESGFSTRAVATEVSGRGVGLDAVRSAVRDLGGTVVVRSEAGRGTTWTLSYPMLPISVRGHAVATGAPFPIVIPESWTPSDRAPERVVDLAVQLGLAPTGGQPVTFVRGSQAVGVMTTQPPAPVLARRVTASGANAFADVVTVDRPASPSGDASAGGQAASLAGPALLLRLELL